MISLPVLKYSFRIVGDVTVMMSSPKESLWDLPHWTILVIALRIRLYRKLIGFKIECYEKCFT